MRSAKHRLSLGNDRRLARFHGVGEDNGRASDRWSGSIGTSVRSRDRPGDGDTGDRSVDDEGMRSPILRPSLAAPLALGLAVVLGACAGSDPSGAVADGPADGEAVRIVMDDDRFLQPRIEVAQRGTVTFEITNSDGGSHDFAVPSQGLNTGTLDSGDVATAEIVVGDEPIPFECTFHDGMRGEIVPVDPAG
jgi:hypothetical protein